MFTSNVPELSEDVIGIPVTYEGGMFAGRTLYGQLVELQKADVGRKYTHKDRRPLDPPPVVQFRLFEVFNVGEPNEYEREFTDYDMAALGMLCHVDLFQLPNARAGGTNNEDIPSHLPGHNTAMLSENINSHSQTLQSNPPMLYRSELPLTTALGPSPARHGTRITANSGPNTLSGDIKCSGLLAGTVIAEAISVTLDGRKAMVFAFPDISVRSTGNFRLRYRVFNILSPTSVFDRWSTRMIAECIGGSFTVYSTADFPGLQESTELSKVRTGQERWVDELNYYLSLETFHSFCPSTGLDWHQEIVPVRDKGERKSTL
ncbi:hypothetical protein K474DRAFT_1598569 [Panus rudis PR-1116 ss-1]|nr:hypothetical protein K474DRAFT_1598569 [Panus rudis PR-1116 ss-1]